MSIVGITHFNSFHLSVRINFWNVFLGKLYCKQCIFWVGSSVHGTLAWVWKISVIKFLQRYRLWCDTFTRALITIDAPRLLCGGRTQATDNSTKLRVECKRQNDFPIQKNAARFDCRATTGNRRSVSVHCTANTACAKRGACADRVSLGMLRTQTQCLPQKIYSINRFQWILKAEAEKGDSSKSLNAHYYITQMLYSCIYMRAWWRFGFITNSYRCTSRIAPNMIKLTFNISKGMSPLQCLQLQSLLGHSDFMWCSKSLIENAPPQPKMHVFFLLGHVCLCT